MGDNRPPVYIEDDNLIIRASAIGHPCLWELIAAGQGEMMMPVPNVLQRAFDEGNLLEPTIIKRLEKDYGMVFESHQSEGEVWLSDDVAIRYHSDGIGTITNDWMVSTRCVVEAKALSNDLWQRARSDGVGSVIEEYPWQLSVMMEGEQLPGLWVAYNKGLPPNEKGEREPCPDAGKLYLQPVSDTPISMTEIQLKASLIKEGVYGEPIISSDRTCGSPDHWPCRYLNVRPEPEGNTAREVFIPEDSVKAEVDRLITEYVSYKGQYDESKVGYERARDALLELSGEAGFIQTDKWWVPIYSGRGQGKLDTESMSPEFKKALERYKRPGKSYKYLMSKTMKRLGF